MSPERSTLAAMIELASANRGDWDSTIQQILIVEARELNVDRASFWAIHEEFAKEPLVVCELVYRRAIGAFERGSRFASREFSDFLRAVTRGPLAFEDVRTEPLLRGARAYIDERQICSSLGCPLWCSGKLTGVLSVEQMGVTRRWSESDVRFAALVAQAASAALEVRAHTEAQQYSLRMSFLAEVALILSQTLDVDEVALRAVALTVPSLAYAAQVDLVNDDGSIRMAAFDCKDLECRTSLERAMQESSEGTSYIARRVIALRDSILVPDLMNALDTASEASVLHPSLVTVLRAAGMRSLIAVPMFVGEIAAGVVTFYSATRPLTVDDLTRAEGFGRSLGAALENARLHQRLRLALQARERFIALAGHELRTPLTALQLNAQELVRKAPNADVGRLGENIIKQGKKLDRLSALMLDATQASELQFSYEPAATDLAAIARDEVLARRRDLRPGGSELLLKANEPVVGEWDATKLHQMLMCLLDNAAKFGAGHPIEVTVQCEGDAATLSVRDQGPGIPADRVSYIFDAFERAVSDNHYGGLGLGLFVARAIAEGHGGTLTVDNRPGDGVTFTARLPLQPPVSVKGDG
jgi:signal transduction histidine kinase